MKNPPKILAWDTEIVFPPSYRPTDLSPTDNIWDQWPFGISVIGEYRMPGSLRVLADPDSQPKGGPGTATAPRLIRNYLHGLFELYRDGWKLFAHNGTGFDWQLLARITGEWGMCAELCLKSYDICFQALAQYGYPIGIRALVNGCPQMTINGRRIDLPDKEMEGGDAPAEWLAGNYERVKEYVSGDALRLAGIIMRTAQRHNLIWKTKKGTISSKLFKKFLTVEDCLALPLPDLSWMTPDPAHSPLTREDVIKWML
jgi:hypothetical protein